MKPVFGNGIVEVEVDPSEVTAAVKDWAWMMLHILWPAKMIQRDFRFAAAGWDPEKNVFKIRFSAAWQPEKQAVGQLESAAEIK